MNSNLFRSLGLTRAAFFDKEHFGEDRLVTGEGSIPWPEFFAKTPMSEQAKKDLTRLDTTKEDYLLGLTTEQKRARLTKISYGLGLNLDRSFKESSYAFHFPDGGASVARLLCKKIVPRSFDGAQDQETIVTARLRYDRLDEEGASVRIRLNSTVIRPQHEGKPDILIDQGRRTVDELVRRNGLT